MQRIFLGFSCNNSCVFCAQGQQRSSAKNPDDAAVQAALTAALSASATDREIAFMGGEPTLRDGLPRWVSQAKSLGASWVLVQTNARRLASWEYTRELSRVGVDALDVSLQGSTAPMHDYHTGVPGGWQETLAGIEQARKAAIAVGVTTVITRSNFRHLSEIVRLAREKGACAVHLDAAEPHGQALAAKDRVIAAAALVNPHLLDAIRAAQKLDLGVYSLQKATTPRTRRMFAGLGEIEAAVAAETPASETAAAPAKKPKPGIKEVHSAQKRTGAELRGLFPDVFKVEER